MSKKKTTTYDDYITNKILGIFTAAFFIIVGLMLTYRGYRSFDTMFVTQKIVYVAAGVFAVISILGVIWEVRTTKAGIKQEYKVVRGKNLAIVAGASAVCAFLVARYFVDGVKAMYIMVPIVTVLALVYIIYSTDFFLISVLTTVGGIWMWLISKSSFSGILGANLTSILNSRVFFFSLAAIILLIVAAGILSMLRKNSGELKGKKILTKSSNYLLLYLSIAVTALAVFFAVIFGISLAYYLIFVLFGYLFILAVYYTVKLI